MDRFDLVDGEKMYLDDGDYCKWEDVEKLLNEIESIIDFYDFDEDGDGYIAQLKEIEELLENAKKSE